MTSDTQAPADVLRTVNETPALLSLLYDANLLPEQADTREKIVAMSAVVRAYQIGSNMAVKVKPLEWEGYGNDLRASAFGIDHVYKVAGEPGDWTLYSAGPRSYQVTPAYKTQAAAQAAAQVDYERRMMAGLEMAPVTPSAIAGGDT